MSDEERTKRVECTICKHIGQDTVGALEKAQLFDEVGTAVTIILCRTHGVELFKLGQKRFLLHHRNILNDIISSDETKFLDILEKTVRSNLDEIF